MNEWKILGISKTKDQEKIREAYREKLSIFHPEEDPEGFKALRNAYEQALKQVDEEKEINQDEIGQWLIKVEEVYSHFGQRLQREAWEKLLQEKVCFQLDTAEEAGERLLSFLVDHYKLPHEVWELFNNQFNWLDKKEELYKQFPESFVLFISHSVIYEEKLEYKYFQIDLDESKDYDQWIDLYFEINKWLSEGCLEKVGVLLEALKKLGINHPEGYMVQIKYKMAQKAWQEAMNLGQEMLQQYPSYRKGYYILIEIALKLEAYDKAKSFMNQLLRTHPRSLRTQLIWINYLLATKSYEKAEEVFVALRSQYGYELYVQNRLKEIGKHFVQYYKQKYEAEPKCIPFRTALARSYYRIGELEACKALITEEMNPCDYNGLMGVVMSGEGNYEQAITYFNKWLTLAKGKERVLIYEALGWQYEKLQRYEEAFIYYNKVLAEEPRNIGILAHKASLLNGLGQYEVSLEICHKGLELEKQAIPLLLSEAEGYFYKQDYKRALMDCEKAISIYPYYLKAYRIQMQVFCKLRQFEKTLTLCKEAEHLGITGAEIIFYRGLALEGMEFLEESEKLYLRCTKQWPKFELAFEQLVYLKLTQGHYKEALEWCNQSMALGVTAHKLTMRGMIYNKLGQYEAALKDYEQILQMNPQSVEIYHKMGMIYEMLGQPEQARQAFLTVVEKSPNHPTVNNSLGELYYKYGQYEKAMGYYNQQILLDPEEEYYINRGWCYLALNNLKAGRNDFRRALKENPTNAYIYYGLGISYLKEWRYSRCIECLKIAIEKDETCMPAYTYLGDCYMKLGRYSKARFYYEKGLKVEPSKMTFYLGIGRSYERENAYPEALSSYEKLLDTNNFEIYDDIGRIYMVQGQYEKAYGSFLKGIEKIPENGKLQDDLAELFILKLENYERAIRFYTLAIKQMPKLPHYYRNRALAYKLCKKNLRAMCDYGKALYYYGKQKKLNEESIQVYYYMAECYNHLNKVKSATHHYKKSIELATGVKDYNEKAFYDSYFKLGELYEKQGSFKEAKGYYKKATMISPSNESYQRALKRVKDKLQELL